MSGTSASWAGHHVRSVAWTVAVALAALIGFSAGSSRGVERCLEALGTEAAGNLVQRVEALSLIRTGDTPEALSALEAQVDPLALTLAANSGEHNAALLIAKAYRRAVPAQGSTKDALAIVLAGLPTPEPRFCSPALRKLMSGLATAPEHGRQQRQVGVSSQLDAPARRVENGQSVPALPLPRRSTGCRARRRPPAPAAEPDNCA
jgi:hypothetical protein